MRRKEILRIEEILRGEEILGSEMEMVVKSKSEKIT